MDPKTNVLIDRNGHARLTDFGLASTVSVNRPAVSLPDASLATARASAAPQISKREPVTKAGDIFAFGMVAAEVCTRGVLREVSQPIRLQQVFGERSLSDRSYAAVLDGERPDLQAKLGDDLCDLIQGCRNPNPGKRPTSIKLVNFFRQS